MRKRRWGALLCGLGLAVAAWTPPAVAVAEPSDPVVTASAAPNAPAPTSPAQGSPAAPGSDSTTAAPTSSAPATPASAPATPSTAPATPTTAPATTTGPRATYIVRYKDGRTTATGAADAADARAVTDLHAFPGVITRLTRAEAKALESDPAVEYVQEDTRVQVAGTQTAPPWGLDRIDQANLPLDSRYTASTDAAGITVYVVDTGIDADNAEFTGRLATGADFVGDGHGTDDCYGHGTHVAGIVGGTTYGVAKGVTLVPVRVLDCSGAGTSSQTVAGLDWVASHHRAGVPAVVNMSLTGEKNQAENDLVAKLVAEGVTVVTAAGNDTTDACDVSPGSAATAITVAATDSADQVASFSNYGRCVDLYAPGVDIRSASPFAASRLMSGTSMASPHVAGVAAMLLAAHRSWTPAQVTARVFQLALASKVIGPRSGGPDRLLNLAPTVLSLAPKVGGVAGGQTVTVTGQRLLGVTRVLIDGVPATGVKVSGDATSLTATTPAHIREGAVSVQVVTELSASNRDVTFTYLPMPTVSSLSPDAGSLYGGTAVTIRGTRFTGATAVRFGSRVATSWTVVSDTEIRAVAPSGSGGVDVRVTTAAGATAVVTAGRFRFGHLPRITSISPGHALTIGGSRITIRGKHFSRTTSVVFGSTPGTSVKVSSSKKLRVTVPTLAVGTVSVRTANRYGRSASRPFSAGVAPPPTITRMSPAKGFAVGGFEVKITGKNFYGLSSVAFGTTTATVVSVTPTTLVVRAPRHAVGDVSVAVRGAYGTSAARSATTYRYTATPAPVIKKLTPTKGTHSGGVVVTISGSSFYAITSVTFGGVAGTNLKVVSATKLKVTTPGHAAGTVDVLVKTGVNLASSVSSAARYSFT